MSHVTTMSPNVLQEGAHTHGILPEKHNPILIMKVQVTTPTEIHPSELPDKCVSLIEKQEKTKECSCHVLCNTKTI